MTETSDVVIMYSMWYTSVEYLFWCEYCYSDVHAWFYYVSILLFWCMIFGDTILFCIDTIYIVDFYHTFIVWYHYNLLEICHILMQPVGEIYDTCNTVSILM